MSKKKKGTSAKIISKTVGEIDSINLNIKDPKDLQKKLLTPQQIKKPVKTQSPIKWITVTMSNADRFKIAAKIVARKYATDQTANMPENEDTKKFWQEQYDTVLYYPDWLIETANKMSWAEVGQSAIKYEAPEEVDYMQEWSSAPKKYIT